MSDERRGKLPIGYWLKRVDELLTRRIDEAQRANGLTRLEWQVMNAVRDAGAATVPEIARVLQPFADADRIEAACAGLRGRGVVEEVERGALRLTPAGADLFDRALAAQKEVRRRSMAGITENEYETTLRTLQRIVANLEAGETA